MRIGVKGYDRAKKRDVKKMLKLGAKAGRASLADIRADIEILKDFMNRA